MHTCIYTPQVPGFFLRNSLTPHLHVDSHVQSRAQRVHTYVAPPSGKLHNFCLTQSRNSLVTKNVAHSLSSVNYKLNVYPCLRAIAWLVTYKIITLAIVRLMYIWYTQRFGCFRCFHHQVKAVLLRQSFLFDELAKKEQKNSQQQLC